MKTCDFSACGRVVAAVDLCDAHYRQMKRGRALTPIDSRFHGGMTAGERWVEKVDTSGDCWLWIGGLYTNGYGQFTVEGRKTTAHRAGFILKNGDPGPGLVIDHKCRNRKCVRPSHLQAVTHSENMQNRGAQRDSRTGVKGVSWHVPYKKYKAEAKVNGVAHVAGYFDSVGEAEEAVIKLRHSLHTNNLLDRAGSKTLQTE